MEPVWLKYVTQTCHFDLTQNLNGCAKKSEYTEKNLNLATKIALLYRNLYQVQWQKKLNFESGYLNFSKLETTDIRRNPEDWKHWKKIFKIPIPEYVTLSIEKTSMQGFCFYKPDVTMKLKYSCCPHHQRFGQEQNLQQWLSCQLKTALDFLGTPWEKKMR